MSSAEENLQEAKRLYEVALRSYRHQREIGGIVPLDPTIKAEADEIAKGCKFRCATPAGSTTMALWQRRKAELDHAAQIAQREAGDTSCGVCDRTQARMARLPTAEQLRELGHWSDREAPL